MPSRAQDLKALNESLAAAELNVHHVMNTLVPL